MATAETPTGAAFARTVALTANHTIMGATMPATPDLPKLPKLARGGTIHPSCPCTVAPILTGCIIPNTRDAVTREAYEQQFDTEHHVEVIDSHTSTGWSPWH